MKIFITGISGLLGSSLSKILAKYGHIVYGSYFAHFVDSANAIKLDLLDYNNTREVFERIKPEIVIHTAYKQTSPQQNVFDMTRYVYGIAKAIRSKFVFLSTDLVFDGEKGNYVETDPPNPITEYGYYKMKCEEFIDKSEDAIVRTSLIYSRERKANHETFIVEKLARGEDVPLFIDSFRNPILSDDLANGIRLLIEKRFSGLIHIAGRERISRYDFAVLLSLWRGYELEKFKAVKISEVPYPVAKDTTLNIEYFQQITGYVPRSFNEVFENFDKVRLKSKIKKIGV